MDNKTFQQTAQAVMIACKAAHIEFTGLVYNPTTDTWWINLHEFPALSFQHDWSQKYYGDLAHDLVKELSEHARKNT